MLLGVAPTHRKLAVPLIVSVQFEGEKVIKKTILHSHLVVVLHFSLNGISQACADHRGSCNKMHDSNAAVSGMVIWWRALQSFGMTEPVV